MGGIFSLFKNLGRSADAIAQKEADKIASDNSVEFGKQDISKIESDVAQVKGNIGTIKGEIAILRDKLESINGQIKKHDEDALALSEKKNDELALQHSNAAESLEAQVSSLKIALETQETLLKEQMQTRTELESALQQAKTDLITIKAMTDAAAANEKLAGVSSSSGENALTAFKQRQEDAKKRLIRSKELKENTSADSSLEQETAKALGKSGGADRLARLKAKTSIQ